MIIFNQLNHLSLTFRCEYSTTVCCYGYWNGMLLVISYCYGPVYVDDE